MERFKKGDTSTPNATPFGNPRFDSELIFKPNSRDAAELRIVLKIYLDPGPVAPNTEGSALDGTSRSFTVVPWGDRPPKNTTGRNDYKEGDWGRFKELVQSDSTTFWNKKMWLKPPADFQGLDSTVPGLPSGKVWRPNVLCGFRCEAVGDQNQAHLRIVCWRIKIEGGRSVDLKYTPLDGKIFTSEARLYDCLDVVPTTYTMFFDVGSLKKGDSMTQNTVCHEIGHALGLAHSAVSVASCATQATEGGPYGNCPAAEEWMPKNIMGQGEIYPEFNGTPWIGRIDDHFPLLDLSDLTSPGGSGSGSKLRRRKWKPFLTGPVPQPGEVVDGPD